MPEPILGGSVFNQRIAHVREQLAIITEAIYELKDNDDITRLELLNLLTDQLLAANEISQDMVMLERFGRVFKQTGELNPDALKR